MRSPCVYNREGKWVIATWDANNKRHDKVIGRGPEAEAKARAMKAEQEELLAKATRTVIDQGPTFGQAVTAYIRHLGARGKTRVHIKGLLGTALGLYYPFFGEHTPIRLLTYAEHIVPFINHLRNSISTTTGRKRSEATVSRYCSYLRSIFNYAVELEFLEKSPMRLWHKPKDMPRRFQLTLDDAVRIMEAADDHVKWAMEICFNLGVRPGVSELLALRWEHVDFDRGCVKVLATKTKDIRTIPVKPAFLQRLREMQATTQSGYLVEFRGKPVKRIHKAFCMAVRRAGIPYPVRMYDFRHMFATFMLANGADLAAVSKLMGHASVKMTADTYYQYMEGEKERAVSLLPDLPVNPTQAMQQGHAGV